MHGVWYVRAFIAVFIYKYNQYNYAKYCQKRRRCASSCVQQLWPNEPVYLHNSSVLTAHFWILTAQFGHNAVQVYVSHVPLRGPSQKVGVHVSRVHRGGAAHAMSRLLQLRFRRNDNVDRLRSCQHANIRRKAAEFTSWYTPLNKCFRYCKSCLIV